MLAITFLASAFLLPKDFGQESKPLRRILILNEAGTTYPLINLVDQGIRTGFEDSPYRIEFYREYMDAILFPDHADQQRFQDFYIRKYRDRRPDVIITVGSSPLKFMIETHRESFPGIPVVFCFGNTPVETGVTLDEDFTGIEGDVAAGATLAAALQLLPDTLHVFEVGGVSPFDRRQEAAVKEQLKPYEQRLDIAYFTDLAMPSLLERLKRLPSHSIVLLTSMAQDAAGSSFTSNESGPLVTSAANAPVFVMADRLLNHGEVGGDISRATEQGRIVAGMALRLLDGTMPRDIPIRKEAVVYMFDSKALKRWGLHERNLPPGSIVFNRQPTLWESYKSYIIGGSSLILVQSFLIFGLMWQRTRRKRVESEFVDLSGQLIEAQEQERGRIAREIHDDYTQRLAVLAIDLEEMAGNIGNANRNAVPRLHQLWSYVNELGVDLHALSHSLHSSTLEQLGLVVGISAFCEEFANQQNMQVDFVHEKVPPGIPQEAALCIFRIVQESLRNVKRHSGADRAEVRLDGKNETVHLCVSDHGRGFDPKVRSTKSGIGLRSIEERLRPIGGRVQIRSRLMEGTKIEVWLPIKMVSRAVN